MNTSIFNSYTSTQHHHKLSQSSQSNKQVLVREGDWVCYFCGNYNYSFRMQCNRCQIQLSFIDYQQPNFYYVQSNDFENEPKWKMDDKINNQQDPMSSNHFQRVLFLTPPKNRRNSSLNKRKILGAIQNTELLNPKQKMEDSLKWISKILDD